MYKLRIKVFLALAAVAVVALIGRLVQLQVLQADAFREEAEQMLVGLKLLPAGRGKILDRRARILADNQACYDVCLDYGLLTADEREYSGWARRQVRRIAREEKVRLARAEEIFRRREGNTWRLVEELAEETGVDLNEVAERIRWRVAAIRRKIKMTPEEQYGAHPVISGLDSPVSISDTVGLQVRPSMRRYYPFGDLACHVIGLLGYLNRDEQEAWNLKEPEADRITRLRRNYHGDEKIGKSGVERMSETILRGLRGYQRFDRRTRKILDAVAAQHGADVHLTLDIALQRDLTNLLRDRYRNGSIVVLSLPPAPARSQVLAMVSVPTFDLNRYRREIRRLSRDQVNFPLRNRAVASLYPPGSTIKPVAALAALATGVIEPQTTFVCRGYLHTPDAFRCWIWKRQQTGHGELDLVGAITHSCNVYFYQAAERTGGPAMVEWYSMFGFSRPPGTGLPEERSGYLPSAEWLRRHGAAPARFMAIGQGKVAATPLHVANVMATVARRGVFVSPQIALEGGSQRTYRKIPIAEAHVAAVHQGMYNVVNEAGGTAYEDFHGSVDIRDVVAVCGKTGTATVPPQQVRGGVVRTGDMAWFAGFAPRRKPKIALAVVVEYVEGGGARNAGPIAHDVVQICKARGYLP